MSRRAGLPLRPEYASVRVLGRHDRKVRRGEALTGSAAL
jgi:hypothetical protein